jgi:hypothetical protein
LPAAQTIPLLWRGSRAHEGSLYVAAPANSNNRQSRSGSVAVVCPEAADQGKPKLFARQSFVVTGDDQMMAETILEARKLGE